MTWDRGFEEAFHPQAIAIVGVSRGERQHDPGLTGMQFLRNLRESEFAGRIYPVNPKASDIEGVKAYPSVTAIPEPLDLVIVTVPAASVPQVLEDCVAANALNVHICTSGFGETGEAEGKRLESIIREIALRGGLRVLGPNSMGLHVPSAGISMLDHAPLVQGAVAFISQSGGHAGTYLQYGPTLGIGFSKVVSYGNALSMDATDFLEYLAGDLETQIICMYLEGIKEGSRFAQLVKQVNSQKPLVVWKGGLTNPGARATASHTGSLAGDRQIWDAFFKQTGAIRVGSIEEMADVTMTLLRLKPFSGRRVAVLGGGGGNSVATADICAEEDLEVPALSAETRGNLMEFISLVNQSVMNPLDTGGLFRDFSLLQRAFELLAADPLIDVVIFNLDVGAFTMAPAKMIGKIGQYISNTARENPGRKPVVAAIVVDTTKPVVHGQGHDVEVEKAARELREAGIAVYSSLRRACRALSQVARYYEFMAEISDATL